MSSRARAALLPAPLGRAGRLLAALLLACGVVLTTLALGARPAYAATSDLVRSLDVAYTVNPSGVLSVKETWVWQFGSESGRHGIKRTLVVREPWSENGKDTDQDAVYTLSNIRVSSPDGVNTDVSQEDDSSQKGRLVETTLTIGSSSETVSAPTATYVITYDVQGALRSSPGANPPYDELYWDVTGTGNPAFERVAVTADVPDGPYEDALTCYAGPVGSKDPCTQTPRVQGDVGVFQTNDLAARSNMTIGVKIEPGQVAVVTPDLQPRADARTPAENAALVGAGVAVGGAAIASPLLGAAYYRRNGRDQRFAGMPPGTFPVGDQQVATELSDPDMQIPVAFVPPKIPVAEAGMLVDGQIDTKETAATLVDLAVRGGLRIISESKDDVRVELRDPNVATAPHEMRLLNGVFRGDPPGTVVDLSSQGSMLRAHQDMDAAVRQQVAARGWFTKVPGKKTTTSLGFAVVALSIFGIVHAGLWALLLAVALLPVVITVAVVKHKMRRGQRTPEGRAWTDQVEGFEKYLATAEADQLRFEEGEDIFSRYLPWAIVFGLADRWAKVCGDLVAMGRIPDTTPYWYYGNLNLASFNTGFLTGALSSAATPVPSASSGSSGTGFGGGSSFGGGGFSGGGGGGGGSSSW
ncbi:Predicted membrane protein [Microlunatus sagamiharensis]|uniref:Predicted membrane protein n=1 Tax=Microlunatus sagamiharensis TaxID=546874 RepID=A0A1H2MG63_9ACTN|nr:DUF2207 domain-containing protein [Microlunatus sagamiharensis]SDU91911.1 Predicted membrane protein [Microlunatus sagamiharensis]